MVDDQNPGPEAPPRNRRGRERRESKGNVRRGATARGSMEKGGYVRFIEKGEIRRDDPIEYFLPAGVRSTSRVPEGVMAIEVPQNEKISRGGKRWREKRVSFSIRWRGVNRGSINIKKREEELFR